MQLHTTKSGMSTTIQYRNQQRQICRHATKMCLWIVCRYTPSLTCVQRLRNAIHRSSGTSKNFQSCSYAFRAFRKTSSQVTEFTLGHSGYPFIKLWFPTKWHALFRTKRYTESTSLNLNTRIINPGLTPETESNAFNSPIRMANSVGRLKYPLRYVETLVNPSNCRCKWWNVQKICNFSHVVRECLLLFGVECLVVQFAIHKYKA